MLKKLNERVAKEAAMPHIGVIHAPRNPEAYSPRRVWSPSAPQAPLCQPSITAAMDRSEAPERPEDRPPILPHSSLVSHQQRPKILGNATQPAHSKTRSVHANTRHCESRLPAHPCSSRGSKTMLHRNFRMIDESSAALDSPCAVSRLRLSAEVERHSRLNARVRLSAASKTRQRTQKATVCDSGKAHVFVSMMIAPDTTIRGW